MLVASTYGLLHIDLSFKSVPFRRNPLGKKQAYPSVVQFRVELEGIMQKHGYRRKKKFKEQEKRQPNLEFASGQMELKLPVEILRIIFSNVPSYKHASTCKLFNYWTRTNC